MPEPALPCEVRASWVGWLARALLSWCLASAVSCEPQTDVVGLLRAEGGGCDGGLACPPNCGAADSCTTDPRCADALVCQPATPNGECSGRGCDVLQSKSTFCGAAGIPFALGDSCASASANPRFGTALCVREDLVTQDSFVVDGDVAVDGTGPSIQFDDEDRANIVGTLRYSGDTPQLPSGVPSAELAAPSCGTDASMQLDIAAAIQARATDNENASSGAADSLAMLSHFSGDSELTLPCGRYYLAAIEGTGTLTIRAQGHVALFVGRNINITGPLRIEATPGAGVSLVVKEQVRIVGGLTLGTLSDARHLLIAGGQINLELGQSTIGGAIYAPGAELLSTSTLDLTGAIFTRRCAFNAGTTIRYAPEALIAADSCSGR